MSFFFAHIIFFFQILKLKIQNAESCKKFFLMETLFFSTHTNSLPDIVGIWVRDWNKAEKALSIPVAMNKQKERGDSQMTIFTYWAYSLHCATVCRLKTAAI